MPENKHESQCQELLLRCSCCKQLSTRPGQFLDPDTWVCSIECKKSLMEKQAYDDLAASGGVVDAP